jgi:hypothetical protein
MHDAEMELVLVDADALPLLLQVSVDAPVIVWTDGPGEDAMCPNCGQVVLLGNVPVNSAYDFMIRCAGCGALSRTPESPPGRGLSGFRTVVPAGTHPSSKVEVFYGQLVVGQPALERRQREARFGALSRGNTAAARSRVYPRAHRGSTRCV